MLLPFDDGQAASTYALNAWAERLDERILPRRWSGRLRRALEAEATAASTRMEGVPVTVDDTLRILAGDPPDHVSDADRALVRGPSPTFSGEPTTGASSGTGSSSSPSKTACWPATSRAAPGGYVKVVRG